jgi:hypothetical protein
MKAASGGELPEAAVAAVRIARCGRRGSSSSLTQLAITIDKPPLTQLQNGSNTSSTCWP